MRKELEQLAGEYDWYKIRREEYQTDERLPFRVSPEPLFFEDGESGEIHAIGHAITDYIHIIDELYRTDGTVRTLLDTGKPDILLAVQDMRYLFVRPDLIITSRGFSMCEVETSPFGLALAQLFAKGYEDQGFEVMVGQDVLPSYIQSHTPVEGVLTFSDKTESYGGQLEFLADHVFSRDWKAERVNGQINTQIYRGFYQSEYLTDPEVRGLMDRVLIDQTVDMVPSLTHHLEEKAILSFLYDRRFEEQIRKQIGDANFNVLKNTVPPNWIVGQEKYFSGELPDAVETTMDLVSLSQKKRAFVLKTSGFSKDASWAEGVHFLGKMSRDNTKKLIDEVTTDKNHLYVVQEFRKATERPMQWENGNNLVSMNARIRLTPYFSTD